MVQRKGPPAIHVPMGEKQEKKMQASSKAVKRMGGGALRLEEDPGSRGQGNRMNP